MSSPRFDHLVQIEQPRPDRDANGQPLAGWVAVGEPDWADIRYLNGLQTIKGDARSSTSKASIRLRWRTDVTAKMRVAHEGGVFYRIAAVLPDMKGREFVDLVCEVISG